MENEEKYWKAVKAIDEAIAAVGALAESPESERVKASLVEAMRGLDRVAERPADAVWGDHEVDIPGAAVWGSDTVDVPGASRWGGAGDSKD